MLAHLQGVKVWCDGKEYTHRQADPCGSGNTAADGPEGLEALEGLDPCNEVLLPFARQDCTTTLVVAADLAVPPPAAAGAGASAPAVAAASKQCVVLVRGFRCVYSQQVD